MDSITSDQRRHLNRCWLRIAVLAAMIFVLSLIGVALRWERSWYVTVNWTESLTHWAFVVDRTADPNVGDYVDFRPPDNPYYQNINFVKQVVAGPGDVVECDDHLQCDDAGCQRKSFDAVRWLLRSVRCLQSSQSGPHLPIQ